MTRKQLSDFMKGYALVIIILFIIVMGIAAVAIG